MSPAALLTQAAFLSVRKQAWLPDDGQLHAMTAANPFSRFRVYDPAGNVVETYEHKGDCREW
jgi:hypothetical protein